MVKLLFRAGFLLALAGLVSAACTRIAPADPQEENGTLPGIVETIVLTAELPGPETRTALSEPDGGVYKVLWQTGDQVSINGLLSSEVSSSDNGKKTVDFTVSGSLSAPYKVLYPGTNSANVIALPATQNYVAGSFDPDAAASFGNARKSGENYIASLTHFCGVICLNLNGSSTLDRIELNALGGEKLYGSFTLATDSDGFTGSWSGGTAGTLIYSFGFDGLALSSTDTPIYIAIPAQAYASGIEALVYQKDGAFMRLKFWGSGRTLGANDIIIFESKTFAAGRTENLFAINSLNAENGGEPTAEPPGITVATYNVMRLDPKNRPAAATTAGENERLARPANAIVRDCAEMQEALGLAIYNTAADLIGFNEIGSEEGYDMYESGRPYSLEDIAASQGASYTWKLKFPASDSGKYHYCNGFAYKSSVLTLNESGKAWLRYNSESYSTWSQSNSGDPNRTVVWARFTHNVSGKVFYFFVAQLPTYTQDGGSGTSNTNMAGGVNAFATAKAGSYPHILVGDMNSAPGHSNESGYNKLKTYWTDAYEAVSAAGNLAAFYSTYPGTQSGTGEDYQYTILKYTKNHPERRVDHIMTHGACTAQSYRTVRNVYEFGSGDDAVTCAPSDHLPVVSYITLD